MTATLESNWIATAKARLACNNNLTINEFHSLEVALMYEELLCLDSRLFDEYDSTGATIDSAIRLDELYARIDCNNLLSETEYNWAKSEYMRFKGIHCANVAETAALSDARTAALLLSSHRIFAAGIHTWNDGASAVGDIPITDLLITDVVHVTMHTQTGAEIVLSAAAAAGQINVVLDVAAADGTTKLNYTAYRVQPAS